MARTPRAVHARAKSGYGEAPTVGRMQEALWNAQALGQSLRAGDAPPRTGGRAWDASAVGPAERTSWRRAFEEWVRGTD